MNRTYLFLLVLFICQSLVQGFSAQGFPVQGFLAKELAAQEQEDQAHSQVSYSRDVRPIFQVHCFGCHQPAKANGGYDMTDFDQLIAGGESELAIVPGKPDESYLLDLITPEDGTAAMPQNAEPLSATQIQTIRDWIAQGATSDLKVSKPTFSKSNPPVYRRQPNATSIDFSPNGKVMAVSGFHEVILFDTASQKQIGRLIGMASRIESVAFSPDGKRLAVGGGDVGRLGEIQIWNVDNQSLIFSKPVSHDLVYSVSWSPDGGKLAFGGADSILRAIDSKSGEQVLFQAAHEDFIRDLVFSVDGSHLVSVGRDMSCKLTEVSTERFIDNITSITPLVLKGGIASIARHPNRDEVLIGGADGVPKIYRMHRLTKRVIGDDANMVRRFPAMTGRISAVDISNNGKRFAVASSLDNQSTIQVYSYEFDSTLPADVKAIMSKVASGRNAAEKKRREEYVTSDIKQIGSVVVDTAIQTVRFHPDGKSFVAAGADGKIRIISTETGAVEKSFDPVELTESEVVNQDQGYLFAKKTLEQRVQAEPKVIDPSSVTELIIRPESIQLNTDTDYAQLVVQAVVKKGSETELFDVTSQAEFKSNDTKLEVHQGLVQSRSAGEFKLDVSLGGLTKQVIVTSSASDQWSPDFSLDVAPLLTKLGCNSGTCHGSQAGQNGFKLSLRGYDRIFDVRSLKGELNSRRIDLSSPESSLVLLKPTGQVPHEGGVLLTDSDKYYKIIRDWIAGGARFEDATNPVVSLNVYPENPVIQNSGERQSFRVVANLNDGTSRDVTEESVIESGNTEVASIDAHVVTALRRGEAPLMARYEGAYVATTMTVMGDREGYAWEEVEAFNQVDGLVIEKWKRMKLRPSALADDATFLRRAHLDLTGLPPTTDEVVSFLEDSSPTKEKREKLIDELIGSPEFVEYWANKWADLLQVNRKYLGVPGAKKFRTWIREQVELNTPYDQFVREILTASGSNNDNAAASYFKILRTPEDIMENTTHLFLGTRFNCNKCHDHPFERWTQDQYYETAAYFAQVKLEADPASGENRIGGTAVEGAKPLYEFVKDADGEIEHDRTKQITPPKFPFDCNYESASVAEGEATRRQEFASWLTSSDNPYFAKSYVNRLWAYMMGVGLIEPIDDIRAGNPPTNPELLDYLTQQFIESGFDTRHVLELICKSRVYQLSIETNPFNEDDQTNYSHALARRLPAEVIYDAVHFVTGSQSAFPGAKPGTRAAALDDNGFKLPSGFLDTLGRPARESSCECERSNEVQLGSVLALISGPDVAKAINDSKNEIAQLVQHHTDDVELIRQLYLRVLNRPATDFEIQTVLETRKLIEKEHQELVAQRDDRQKIVDERRPALEKERNEAIARATQDLNEFITKTDPGLLAREEKQRQAIASAEAKLKEYQADPTASFTAWKDRQINDIQWMPIIANRFDSTNKSQFEQRSDRSILVKKFEGAGEYIIETQANLSGITAIRLEALADSALPSKGPGLAENGNFVLSEFEVEIAAIDSDDWKKVPIQSVISDFDQATYLATSTLDGNRGGGNGHGWAVVPQTGKTHWATYQLAVPIGFRTGSKLRFRLHQNYDPTHLLGCFRISLSQIEVPVGLSVSEEVLAKLNVETPSQQETKYFGEVFARGDIKLRQLQALVAEAKKPLGIDAGIVSRRKTLARVSQPIPDDPQLVRLESDVKYSAEQLKNKRLTIAQDLTWVLINSPSFLFNH